MGGRRFQFDDRDIMIYEIESGALAPVETRRRGRATPRHSLGPLAATSETSALDTRFFRMKRQFAISLIVPCIFALCASALADAPGALVPETSANSAGLTRAWFAQATLQRGTEWVTSATVQDGTLFTTTDGGRLQAFDAETGASLWSAETGTGYLLPPSVNSKVVAAICGTNLLVFDRFTGKKLRETSLYGNPSAGPLASEREIYAPSFSERITSYKLVEEESESKKVASTVNSMSASVDNLGKAGDYWQKKFAELKASAEESSYMIADLDANRPNPCASFGVVSNVPILATQSYETDYIGWVSDKGWLVLGRQIREASSNPFRLHVKFQVRPNFSYVTRSRIGNKALIPRDDVQASPFFFEKDLSAQSLALAEDKRVGGLMIVGSESGHVHAFNDVTGELRWTFLTRSSVSTRISAFDDAAYVPSESGDLFAINMKDGREKWECPDVNKVLAASKTRLYAIDTVGRLVSINRDNGNRESVLDVGRPDFQVFNRYTDRVYLVSRDGLVQCLRETGQVEPVKHCSSCAEIAAKIRAEMGVEESATPNGAAAANDAAKAGDAARPESAKAEDEKAEEDVGTNFFDDEEDEDGDGFEDEDEEDGGFGDNEEDDSDPFADDGDDDF